MPNLMRVQVTCWGLLLGACAEPVPVSPPQADALTEATLRFCSGVFEAGCLEGTEEVVNCVEYQETLRSQMKATGCLEAWDAYLGCLTHGYEGTRSCTEHFCATEERDVEVCHGT